MLSSFGDRIPSIPLDVVVLIAEYCIKEDWKMGITFYKICKKLQNNFRIKRAYLIAKRIIVRNFLLHVTFHTSPFHMIFRANDCNKRVAACTNESIVKVISLRPPNMQVKEFKNYTFCYFQNNDLKNNWHRCIAINDDLENFKVPFLIYVNSNIRKSFPLQYLSWEQGVLTTEVSVIY